MKLELKMSYHYEISEEKQIDNYTREFLFSFLRLYSKATYNSCIKHIGKKWCDNYNYYRLLCNCGYINKNFTIEDYKVLVERAPIAVRMVKVCIFVNFEELIEICFDTDLFNKMKRLLDLICKKIPEKYQDFGSTYTKKHICNALKEKNNSIKNLLEEVFSS